MEVKRDRKMNDDKIYCSPSEILKIVAEIDDSIVKINKIMNKMFEAENRKDFIVLLQIQQNLLKLREKLARLAKAETLRQARKTLEKAKGILGENRGLKFRQLELSQELLRGYMK
ncbi:hypothetical protein H5T51_04915 [Candidatus Bathyarchaeota archaeon]|nr:hypothetical protein [Candidatus Bathyarchaeota archaeon]